MLPMQVINIPVLSGTDEVTPWALSLTEHADGNFAAALMDANGVAIPNAPAFFFPKGTVAVGATISAVSE